MSDKAIPRIIDPNAFAIAVVKSASPKGITPEEVAQEQLEQYLAAYKKAQEFNHPNDANPLEHFKKEANEKGYRQ